MNLHRFDALTRLVSQSQSRRAILPVLGGLLAAPLVGVLSGEAKKKKKKKFTLCFNGQTVKVSKKKKKNLLKQGATPGECPPPPPNCVPNCPGNTCGGDDGCGGICGCGQSAICDGGICKGCDITDVAGLNAALAAGGAFVVCPGRYVGSFNLAAGNVTLLGAGNGDDPATSTILDANGAGRVVEIAAPVTANFQKLRITGGAGQFGAGVNNNGTLTLTDCTVTGNTSPGAAGGINNFDKLNLNGCTVSGNSASVVGGGMRNGPDGTLNVNNSDIIDNTAGDDGGGVFNQGDLIFTQASEVRNNTATTSGGGIFNSNGTVTLNDTIFSGNNPNDCTGCI